MQYKFCIFFSEFVLYLNLFFWCYTVRYILNLSFMTSLFRTVMENFSLTCTQAMKLSVYHGYVKIKVKLLVCKLLFMTVSWISYTNLQVLYNNEEYNLQKFIICDKYWIVWLQTITNSSQNSVEIELSSAKPGNKRETFDAALHEFELLRWILVKIISVIIGWLLFN